MESLGGVDIPQASDPRLIKKKRFDLPPAASQDLIEIFVREVPLEGFRSQPAEGFRITEIAASYNHHHREVSLIGEEEPIASVQPEDRVRMIWIGRGCVDDQESPGHSKVSDQSSAVVQAEKNVLSSPGNLIDAGCPE
jgi:hypothetical protein